MDAFDKECPRCHGKGLAAPVASTPVAPPPNALPVSPAQNTKANKKLGACCAWGCILPVLGFIFLMIISSTKGPSDATDTLGYVIAREEITRQLKSPTTAKFPYPHEAGVTMSEANGVLLIISYVDAQNSFGAMIRSRWSARLRRSSDRKSWTVLEATLVE